jgi:hypothetical protein
MDTTIEREFFKAFEFGGDVSRCIDLVMYIHHITLNRPKEQEQTEDPFEYLFDVTNREAPVDIKYATKDFEERFDNSVICIFKRFGGCQLMNEIEKNLNELKDNVEERDRYIIDMLEPFGRSNFLEYGIGRICVPTAEINRLKLFISAEEESLSRYRAMPENEEVENGFTAKDMAKTCEDSIEDYKKDIEWELYVSREFENLMGGEGDIWRQEWTIEWCLKKFYDAYKAFACSLYFLLLRKGIDLNAIQKESGLYIVNPTDPIIQDFCFGNSNLLEYYQKRLSHSEPQQKEKECRLPISLDVGEARKYIDRAIEKGWIEINGNSGKWLFVGVSRLAYFCLKVFAKPRPISDLERFFGVKSLAGMISNIENEDKDRELRNDVRIWREEMDNVLFYD